ncbi:calcium ion binding protein [Aureococcus anophagefferens]|nr:calcium ion binding protein [Aureococcus anophagefferens]
MGCPSRPAMMSFRRRLWAAALVVGTTRAQNCPAGSYADGGSCVVCPAGFYAKNSGSTSCNDCNAGKYISDDGVDIAAHDEKSDCLVCPAGAYAAVDGATGCELCPAGSYLDGGAPTRRARTYQASAASHNCVSCPGGTYLSDAATDAALHASLSYCEPCPAGSFSTAGVAGGSPAPGSCTLCPAGTYSAAVGATSCETCGAGTYAAAAGSTSCLSCPAGDVPARSRRGGDARRGRGLRALRRGHVLRVTGGGCDACAACPEDEYASAGSDACFTCAEGASSDDCIVCEPGTYDTDDSGCVDCPVCTYSEVSGATECAPCPAGHYADEPGSRRCEPAGAGFYATDTSLDMDGVGVDEGACSAVACPTGTWSPSGASSCVAAFPGYLRDVPHGVLLRRRRPRDGLSRRDLRRGRRIVERGVLRRVRRGLLLRPGVDVADGGALRRVHRPARGGLLPAGAAAPTPAAEGEYTTPRWGSAYARTAVASCAVDADGLYAEYCPGDGSRFADLVSLDCPATLDLPEKRTAWDAGTTLVAASRVDGAAATAWTLATFDFPRFAAFVNTFEDDSPDAFGDGYEGPGGVGSSAYARNGMYSWAMDGDSLSSSAFGFDLGGGDGVTVAFWLRPDGWGGASDDFTERFASFDVTGDLAGVPLGCQLWLYEKRLEADCGARWERFVAAVEEPPLYDGVWTHVAIILSADALAVALDGEVAARTAVAFTSANDVGAFASADVDVGWLCTGDCSGLGLRFDDIAVFSMALAPSELGLLMGGWDPGSCAAVATSPLAVDDGGAVVGETPVDALDCDFFYATFAATTDASGAYAAGEGSCTARVAVVDANDAPYFSSPSFAGAILESASTNAEVGAPLLPNVTEPDPYQSSIFSLPAGCGDNDLGKFAVVACTGQVFATTSSFDALATPTYELCVAVTDDGDPPLNATAAFTVTVLNVNDAPVFDEAADPSACSLPEDAAAGDAFGCALAASDPDGDALAWTLADPHGILTIGGATGALAVAAGAALDYETAPTYAGIQVFASDGEFTASHYLTVNLADANDAPAFPSTATFAIAEDAAAGDAVGDVASYATDADGDALSFSLGAFEPAGFGSFAVSSDGAITVADASGFDFETFGAGAWNLTILVSDGVATASGVFVVTLENVDEPPALASDYAFVAAEDAAVGSILGDLTATDPDAGAIFLWSCGDCAGGAFALSTPYGSTATAAVTLNRGLDYETQTSYDVAVTVTDGAGNAAEGRFAVAVTDVNEAPVLHSRHAGPSTALVVDENAPLGTVLASIAGGAYALSDDLEDLDAGQSHTFTLLNASGAAERRFSYDGDFSVLSERVFDYEDASGNYFFFAVSATDDGTPPLDSNSITICVAVQDVDEAPVVFDVAATVGAGAVAGQVVAVLDGVDPDDDDIAYTISVDSAWDGWFAVDGDKLSLARRGRRRRRLGRRRVRGAANGLTSATATATITFSAAAPTPPAVVSPQRFDVPEDAAVGDLVASVAADDDGVVFAVVGGSGAAHFAIDGASGQLTVATVLDFEARAAYDVDVSVSDGDAASYVVARINVTDVPEAPTLAATVSVVVAEDAPLGAVAGQVVAAADEDAGDAVTFAFEPADGAAPVDFTSGGQLTVTGALDYETRQSYAGVLTATDAHGLSATTFVTVVVADVNEPPAFASTSWAAGEIDENGGFSLIGSLGASDPEGDALAFNCSSPLFEARSDGNLYVAAGLDFEAATAHSFTVTASDGEFDVALDVSVTVGDVNDAAIASITPATLAPRGGDAVYLVGTDLGPKYAGVATTINATYVSPGDGAVHVAYGCEVTTPGVELRCYADEGVGAHHAWTVTVAAANTRPWRVVAAALTSYETPAIVSVDDGLFDTAGGDLAFVTASGLGPACETYCAAPQRACGDACVGAFDCAVARVTAGAAALGDVLGLNCSTAAGYGAAAHWRLEVGVAGAAATYVRSSAVFEASTSYEPPSVASVVDAAGASDPTTLDTRGGDVLTVSGSNFGPAGLDAQSPLTGTYGGYALACEVTKAHVEATCETSPGVGADLAVSLARAGLAGTAGAASVGYGAPTITAVSGLPTQGGATEGGDAFYVSGSNFGPGDGDVVVTYGPYVAEGCAVEVAHEKVRCATAAGTGVGHGVAMNVAGRSSATFDGDVSYAAPFVSYYEVGWALDPDRSGALAVGGETVVLRGGNFGASTAKLDAVTYGEDGAVDYIACDVHGAYGGVASSNASCLCAISEAHGAIECETVAATGTGHTWHVTVDGQGSTAPTTTAEPPLAVTPMASAFYACGDVECVAFVVPPLTSDARTAAISVALSSQVHGSIEAVSNGVAFTYDPPVITHLSNSDGAFYGTTDVVVNGRNFGTGGAVHVDGEEIAATTYAHDRATFTFDGTSGNVTVVVGDATSNSVKFSTNSPRVAADVADVHAPDPAGYRTDGLDDAGAARTISVVGYHFASSLEGTRVFVGDAEAAVTWVGDVDDVDTDLRAFGASLRGIVFEVPPGTGRANEVLVMANGRSSYSGNLSSDVLWVRYLEPAVDAVAPGSAPTAGGDVTLTGSNFGASGAAVSLGGEACRVTSQSHASLTVAVPEGEGRAKAFVVDVGGQTASTMLGYDAPAIASLSPEIVPATGGLVTVSGSNLGRAGVAAVALGPAAVDVAVVSGGHDVLVLNVGAGQGLDTLVVNVSDQSAKTTLAFEAPSLSNFDVVFCCGASADGTVSKYSYLAGDVDVLNFSDASLVVSSPAGQSDAELAVTFEACADAGRPASCVASNALAFNFSDPRRRAYYVGETVEPYDALGDYCFVETGASAETCVEASCDRTASGGCGLSTAGGALVAVPESDDAKHGVVFFEVPRGSGRDVEVVVEVGGGRRANAVLFSYDAPVVTSVTPNAPQSYDGAGQTVEIFGENFGETAGDAGAVSVLVGGLNCTAAADYAASERKIAMTCPDGYYAQTKHQPYTTRTDLGDVACHEACVPGRPCANASTLDGTVLTCAALTTEDEYCVPCPTGSACDKHANDYVIEPYATPGYFRLDLRDGDVACGDQRGHRGDTGFCYDFAPCSPADACVGGNACARGYTATKCARCCDASESHVTMNGVKAKNPECWDEAGDQLLYYRAYGECVECPANLMLLIAMLLSGALVCGAAAYVLKKNRVDMSVVAIGVDYFQVLSVFASTDIKWPSALQDIYSALSLFSFDVVNIFPPECSVAVAYDVQWLGIQFAPLGLRRIRGAVTGAALYGFYFVYLFICENTLDVLNCEKIASEDGVESEEAYLSSEPEEICWRDGEMQYGLVPVAVIFVFVYVVGYPVLVAVLTLRGDVKQKIVDDQLLRAQGRGGYEAGMSPYLEAVALTRNSLGLLYYRFKPDVPFWIVVVVLRKMCMAMRNLPYLSPKDAHLLLDVHKDRLPLLDEEEKKSKASKDAALSRKRTKRVQVGADGFAAAYRSGRLREAAAELVFEYNTIECTLLSASIMICIFGVMLASEYVADGKHPAARSALVHATLVVIALSLLYFAAVLWHEIISKIFPMLNFSCLGIFADDQQKTKDAPDDDVLDDGTLMTVEEQIAMQKVVAGLQRDNGVLKKRIADLETQGREKVAKQYSKVKKKAIGSTVAQLSKKQLSNVGAQDAGYDDGGGDATFGIDVGFDDGDEPRARSNTENPMARHRSGTQKNAHV